MFEEYTYEYLLNKMLNSIQDDIDKREGSVIYNAIAPAAFEISEQYKKLASVVNLVFPDTSSGEYLERLIKQFGIERNPATSAIRKGIFLGKENQPMDLELGKRFSIDGVIYKIEAKIDTGVYQLKCEETGTVGNLPYGNLLPLEYISNLVNAKLMEILVPGVDQETDEELRDRFYKTIDNTAFGGNIVDYKQKVKKIEGVGAVKVIPAWNGGGTVKLVILDSNYDAASEVLIEKVQEKVGQDGDGIAPIRS